MVKLILFPDSKSNRPEDGENVSRRQQLAGGV